MESVKTTAIQMLSVLTGRTISRDSKFVYSVSPLLVDDYSNRPEIHLFESQRMQLGNQINLLDKSRHPKIFGFGQAGHGKPGLNMLSDKFNSYYLFGAGFSWSAPDWNKTKRQKQILKLQQEIINTQEEIFIQNVDLLIARQQEEIIKLEQIIESDKIMVELRGALTKAAASRMENETITTSEYIREIQSETVAKLNYELHKIQLAEALEKHNLIKGKK